MSQVAVENIIREIAALTEEEREQLETRLAEIDEAKWLEEAVEARRIAGAAGIDQSNIDQVIERLRHQ